MRNQPEPADLVADSTVLILLDGAEEEPKEEDNTGVLVHRMKVGLEGYVAGTDPASRLNDLLTAAREAALSDRRVSGLTYGHLREEFKFPFFDGLALGPLADFDPFREYGSSHGGYFLQEFWLQYATQPTNATVLVRVEDVET